MLEDGKLGRIGFYEEDHDIAKNPVIMENLKSNFYAFSPYFKKNIAFITKPFSLGIANSMGSLIRDDVWNSIGEQYGTILNMHFPFDKVSCMYYIREGDNGIHTSVVYYFTADVFVGMRVNTPDQNHYHGLFSNVFIKYFIDNIGKKYGRPGEWTKEEAIVELDNLLYTSVIAYINFLRYAKVVTKTLAEGQKAKGIDCKYLESRNETKLAIKVLDSTFFTELHKPDGFKVRRHIRLQPKKVNGEWTKELIWIEEFQKHGYTRRAGIEQEQGSTV